MPEHPPQPCRFCTEPAEVLCSGHSRVQIVVFPCEVQIGDIYLSAADGQERSVIQVEVGEFRRFRTLKLACEGDPVIPLKHPVPMPEPIWIFHCAGENGVRVWQVHCPDLPVLVKRLTLCGAPACWKHYRELSDGVYWCQDHWMVGEEEPVHPPDSRSLHKHWKQPLGRTASTRTAKTAEKSHDAKALPSS